MEEVLRVEVLRGVEDELTFPEGANVQWTFGERTERPCARLTKCPFEFLLDLKKVKSIIS